VDYIRKQRRNRRILANVPANFLSSGQPPAALTALINFERSLILSSVNLPSGFLQTRHRIAAFSPGFQADRYGPDTEEAP
jgi:hypothetical protein